MAKNHIGGARSRAADGVKIAVMVIMFVFFMIPFIMVFLNAFKYKRDIITNPFSFLPDKGFTFSNFITAFEKMNFMQAFGNSLIITTCSTAAVIFLSAMLAYYIARARNGASKTMYAMMIASMIIPFQAIMIPLVSVYGAQLNWLNHRITLIFLHTGFAMSMSVFMYSGFIRSNINTSLEEAAYLDGCTRTQTFFKIVLPLMKPTTATLVILNVLAFWNDYLLPSLVLGKKTLYTLPLSTYSFYGTYSSDYGNIMAALVLTVIPILFLYLFLQKQIVSGVVAGAVKS